MTEPARVSFPRGAWVVLAAFGVLLLGCLAALVVLIGDQRAITRDQRQIADRQLRIVAPLIETSRPLVHDVRQGLPKARAIARRGDRLARAATPLVEQLDGAELARAIRAAGALSTALLRGDAPRALQRLVAVAAPLQSLLAGIRANRLVGRATLAAKLVPRLFEVQREALQLQRQQLATARQTLVITRETAKHAASVDRKLGGELPTAGR